MPWWGEEGDGLEMTQLWGRGLNRDLLIPRKEIIEETAKFSTTESDGRDNSIIWNEGEPGGTSGNAFHQEEKQQDLVPVGPCSLHLWRAPSPTRRALVGPQSIGYRPPMVPSHLNHPKEDPGTTSATAPVLHHKAPTDPSTFPRHLLLLVQPESPGFNGEKHGQRMSAVKTCPGRCLPAWEHSPGTWSIPDKRGGSSGAAQIRPNKGPAVTCRTKTLL